MMIQKIGLLILLISGTHHLQARESMPLPRFASIKPERANIRVGPGPGYPIEWVVVRAGVPVEITAEFDNWCRLNFPDGSQGWVHRNMLAGKRTAWIMASDTSLLFSPEEESAALARLEKGVLVSLQKCEGLWCQVKVDSRKGWIKRQDIWGVYANETLR